MYYIWLQNYIIKIYLNNFFKIYDLRRKHLNTCLATFNSLKSVRPVLTIFNFSLSFHD